MAIKSSTNVVMHDVATTNHSIRRELNEAIEAVIDCSRFTGHRASHDFELSFAAMAGRKSALGVGSLPDAYAVALLGLGIGPGDEVIVPAMGSVLPAEAVVRIGATPVIADVDSETLLLSEEAVEARRTDATRAVLAVHLYGNVIPFDAIARWSTSSLLVIEDATEAPFATWKGAAVGSISNAVVQGFPPDGVLGAFGEPAVVLTDDMDLAADVYSLRSSGRISRHECVAPGVTSHMDGIQSAVLDVKLHHCATWIGHRAILAQHYRSRLGDMLVPATDGAVASRIVIRVHVDDRDQMVASLAAAGVETDLPYPVALSQQLGYAAWSVPCEHAEEAAAQVIGLPIHEGMSIADVEAVCDTVDELR